MPRSTKPIMIGAARRAPALLALLMGQLLAAGDAAAATQILDYRVSVAVFGDIGSYQNRIETAGDVTTVRSTLRTRVQELGIVLHRESADRIERWEGGRLVYFDGTTTTNGKSVHIHGQAQGDGFALTTPAGTSMAAGDLFPSNPWSSAFIAAHHILHVTTGEVEPAQVVAGETTTFNLAGRAVTVRAYRIDTALTHALVWLDASSVPVRIEVRAHGRTVILDLQSETTL
ncbi:MAG: hypothetical protein JOY64_27830 [Alphaproteobacteria bacterium]|nr:hypothetical protein [Alphaproteobacteria bacterium]